MNVKSIILKNWGICGNCGCKLFKLSNQPVVKNIEIKCHACKIINEIKIGGNKND